MNKRPFPYSIEKLDPKLNEEVSNNFSGGMPDLVQVGPKKVLISGHLRKYADDFYNFPLRSDDIFITGYPRSGTNLMQEMVYLMVNNVDIEKAQTVPSYIRVPLLERNLLRDEMSPDIVNNDTDLGRSPMEILSEKSHSERRVIKTHLHFDFLTPELFSPPHNTRVIYMARNPKDVIASYYHLQSSLHPSTGQVYVGTFDQYYDYFKRGLIRHTPYWNNLAGGWNKKTSGVPNFLFLFYEEVVSDLRKYITTVADFLKVELSDDKIDLLEKVMQFDNFKQYRSHGYLEALKGVLRTGKIGEGRNVFNQEQLQDVDHWVEDNAQGVGIKYPFKI